MDKHSQYNKVVAEELEVYVGFTSHHILTHKASANNAIN